MKEGRYSIEVCDSEVLIHGYLTIREAFDFLAFFDQQGFKSVWPGDENSVMRLTKLNANAEETLPDESSEDTHLENAKFIRELLKKNDGLKMRVEQLTGFIKDLLRQTQPKKNEENHEVNTSPS